MRNELFNIVIRLSAFTLFMLITNCFIVDWIKNKYGLISFNCLIILMSLIFFIIAFREDKTKTALFDIFTRLIACVSSMAVFSFFYELTLESVSCLGFIGVMLIGVTGFSFIFAPSEEISEPDSEDKHEVVILAAIYAYENNVVGQKFINLPFRDKYIRVEIWCDSDGEKHEPKGQYILFNEVVRISKRSFGNKSMLRS